MRLNQEPANFSMAVPLVRTMWNCEEKNDCGTVTTAKKTGDLFMQVLR